MFHAASLRLNHCNHFSHYCGSFGKEKKNEIVDLQLADVALQRCSLTPLTVLLLMKTLEKDRYGSSMPMIASRAGFLTYHTCNVAAFFFFSAIPKSLICHHDVMEY